MDTADARFWLDAIAIGSAGVWTIGAWFVLRTARTHAKPLRGERDVAASPATVLTRLGQQIAKPMRGSLLQTSTVEEATARELRWQSVGIVGHSGTLTAVGDSKHARVAWEIVGRSRLLRIAGILVAIGGVVIVALYLALRTWVATSANEAVRFQSMQMLQVIHVLWPPFVLAGVARLVRRRIADEVGRIVQNTPFA